METARTRRRLQAAAVKNAAGEPRPVIRQLFCKEATVLVLCRKPEESLVFPDLGITVLVCSVDGERVRLGIQAPSHVRVFRDELMDRIDPWIVQAKPEDATDGSAK